MGPSSPIVLLHKHLLKNAARAAAPSEQNIVQQAHKNYNWFQILVLLLHWRVKINTTPIHFLPTTSSSFTFTITAHAVEYNNVTQCFLLKVPKGSPKSECSNFLPYCNWHASTSKAALKPVETFQQTFLIVSGSPFYASTFAFCQPEHAGHSPLLYISLPTTAFDAIIAFLVSPVTTI